jgi:hypothetical protein
LIRLDRPSFDALTAGGKLVESDPFGPKVYLLPDGTYLKLFRRQRLVFSVPWSPYSQRFVANCRALAARGIPCPEVIACYRVPSLARDVVHYRALPGQTLRQLLEKGLDEQASARLRRQYGTFVARLHALGIYFRSLHLGNVVLTPQGELGLIDVADMRVRRRALGRFLRARNIKHMHHYRVDTEWLVADDEFIAGYGA